MTQLVSCGGLFDGTGAPPITGGATLVVDGEMISEDPAPAGSEHIDLGDWFVMPGLIDAHAHLSTYELAADRNINLPDRIRQIATLLREDLDAGVTTMRVLGEDARLDVVVREAVRRGDFEGPDLLVAGRAIDAGEGSAYDPGLATPAAVREMALENLAHQVDWLKIRLTGGAEESLDPLFGLEAIRSAVIAGERAGVPVAAHAHGGQGLRDAVRAGVKTIEHGFYAEPDDLETMRENACALVCTYGFDFHPDGFERMEAGDPTAPRRIQALRKRVERHARLALGSGVQIALGSNHLRAGYLAEEILLAIRFGLSITDALLAATSSGAKALGIDAITGSLQPGKRADLIALPGNPFVAPEVLREPVFVMKAGQIKRAAGFEFSALSIGGLQ